MSGKWLERRKRDYYYRRAKEEKYRSRAAYKLLEAIKKYGFMRPGDIIVDLGAAPGGWLQAARQIVGEKGFVLGIDLREIEPLNYDNVHLILGDIRNLEIIRRIKAILPRSADVVISDVSPNISGIWELDHARQIELAENSLKIALSVLRRGGSFFIKVFQGEFFSQFLSEVKNHFMRVEIIKPKASRKESAEIYLLGMNYRGFQHNAHRA
ncbi:23S rRNA (uridine(2552)-2'-O)-methyltransferase [Candidatus Bathyarchaeota archaeon]|nr:23S rRNA (uridine(2552)-2'-O)-methyltransferase [Candidatus Bathyarchaeota archaeon]